MKNEWRHRRFTIRIIGFVFVLFGLWMLVANVIESWGKVSPVFFMSYLQSQIFRPVLAILMGLCTMVFSGPITRMFLGKNDGNET